MGAVELVAQNLKLSVERLTPHPRGEHQNYLNMQ
jgi:hypothetical protein